MKSMKVLFATAALAIALPCAYANATAVSDPPGDFLPSYTGPLNGDMDVLSANFLFDGGSNFVLSATMNGAIGTTAGGLYVLGVDRGNSTLAPFGNINNPNVIFNAIVIVNDNSTGSVTDIGGSTFALAPGSISISGDSFTAIIPTAFLPSTGLALSDYLWNLWPRDGAAGNSAIPDFAPDNAMARTSVPEPASLALFGLGALGFGLVRRRRNRS